MYYEYSVLFYLSIAEDTAVLSHQRVTKVCLLRVPISLTVLFGDFILHKCKCTNTQVPIHKID